MSMREHLRPRWRWLAFAVMSLYCAMEFHDALTRYQRTPHDPRSQVGVVHIDLAQLRYRLKYADLQAAGLFADVECAKCDFSPGGHVYALRDDANPQFIGRLWRGKDQMSLSFHSYARDFSAAPRRFEQAVQALRARFPGQEEAIDVVDRGYRHRKLSGKEASITPVE